MEYEIKANKYSMRCIARSLIVLVSMWLLNELNVFIIDKYLLRYATFTLVLMWGSALFILHINGVEKKWFKYFALAVEAIGVSIVYIFISYHVILVLPLPFLMAANYQEKRVTMFTYIVSIVSICISILLNYQYGLCDMNMVLFTSGALWNYGGRIEANVGEFDAARVANILLFFAFPRCLILTLYAGMASTIAKSGKELHIHREAAEKASKTDKMTGLKNKNEYLRVIKEEYVNKEHIGVIFVDINNLKTVNDKYGHEKGDELINKVAKSIKYIEDEGVVGYRIGGDEFVILLDNASNARLMLLTEQWKKILNMLNENDAELPCSAAYGYAYGSGKNLDDIIDEADKNMYECKRKMKEIMY